MEENETQTIGNERDAENLLGIETPKYQQIELGGWKPKIGISTFKFISDRIEVRSSKDGKVYKNLKIVLQLIGEDKLNTLSLVWKDNPNPKSNLGRWVKFRQQNDIRQGTTFLIARRSHETNPEWSEYEFHPIEPAKA